MKEGVRACFDEDTVRKYLTVIIREGAERERALYSCRNLEGFEVV